MIPLSIIIINHNDPVPLHYCLQQLRLQLCEDDEIILVDDGSIVPLRDIIDVSNINYQYIPRTELSSRANARNYGANIASNHWLVFLDGDCVPSVSFLDNYRLYIQNHKNIQCMVGTRVSCVWSDQYQTISTVNFTSTNMGYVSTDLRISIQELIGPLTDYSCNWIFFWSCNFCITKDLYLNIGGMDTNFKGWGIEDIDLGYRLIRQNQIDVHFLQNDVIDNCKMVKSTISPNLIQNYMFFYSKHLAFEIMDMTPLIIDIPQYGLTSNIEQYTDLLICYSHRYNNS